MVSGTIIYRSLTEERGLEETKVDFESLDELFDLIMSTRPPYLVDRIAITGRDETTAKRRMINFVFRSIQSAD